MSIKRPQPSPVLPSAPIPPLWVMLIKASMESVTIDLDLMPSILAIRPNPQLSRKSFFL